jgi:TorA maturation chaperone TorD
MCFKSKLSQLFCLQYGSFLHKTSSVEDWFSTTLQRAPYWHKNLHHTKLRHFAAQLILPCARGFVGKRLKILYTHDSHGMSFKDFIVRLALHDDPNT